jgi:subfamily B ATP-binding cassette protein MsbA
MTGILAFIVAVFLLKGTLKFAEGAYKSHLQAELLQEVQTRLVNAYSTVEYRYYSQYSAGHFTSLISVQIPRLVTSFERYTKVLGSSITVVAYFVFAFLISWPFATMATVAGVSMLLVFRRLTGRVRRWSREGAVEHGTLNHFLVQTLQAYKYLAATARLGPLRAEVLKSIGRVAGFQRRKEIAWSFTEALQEPLSVAVLVVIIVVQIAVLNQALAPVLVGLVLIYRAMGQLVLVQGHWQAMMHEVGSLEIVEAEIDRVSKNQQITGRTALGPLTRGIELRRVSFGYDDVATRHALEDVTLSIPPIGRLRLLGNRGPGRRRSWTCAR